jgi:hypothetical protein
MDRQTANLAVRPTCPFAIIPGVKDRQKEKLDAISTYLDGEGPIVSSAWEAQYLVTNAPDEKKLDFFDQAFIRMRDEVAGWVRDAFQRYLEVAKDPALAEQHLLRFLEPRLGHQMKSQSMDNWLPAYYSPPCHAHKTIIWWVVQAAAEPGNELPMEGNPLPPEEETDAEMLERIDASLAEQWIPPSWLWRIPDYNGHRETIGLKTHSRETAKRELAYIHWQVWEKIETAVKSVKSRAVLERASRAVKKPRKKSDEDRKREQFIRYAIREGYSGERFCNYLDQCQIKPLPGWKGWPGSWAAAYHGKFQKKIQDLKFRHANAIGKAKKLRRS